MLTFRIGDPDSGYARVEAEMQGTPPEGTATPEFHYTVTADDEDRDGIDVPRGTLTLDEGARLEGQYGNAVVLRHGPYGRFAEHTVNAPPPPPMIRDIYPVSSPAEGGHYQTGETIEMRVVFDARVFETLPAANAASASLVVQVGDKLVEAEGVAGTLASGTAAPEFRYTVRANDIDKDGIHVPAGALKLVPGARLEGRSGNAADRRHRAYGPWRASRVNSPTAAPSAPTNLVVMAPNENEVTFRWDPPADDGGAPVTDYAYRYDANDDGVFVRWAYVGSTPGGQPPRRSWGIDVEADGDEVCVQVMAVNEANFRPVSSDRGAPNIYEDGLEGNETQAKCVMPYGPAEGAPQAPGWLRVTSTQADRADLEWDEPDESGDSPLWGYRIEVSTDGGERWDAVVANTGTASLSRSDAGVDDLANRLYRVSAVNTEERVGNPSPPARLAPMTLEGLATEPAQHFENPDDERASSHSVTATVALANPAPGRRVHLRLLHGGELAKTRDGEVLAPRVVEARGTRFDVRFEDLPAGTTFRVNADVVESFDSPEALWKLAITMGDIRQGGGPGRGVEVDTDGDGVAEDDPRLTVAMGAAASLRVRPGACTGAKKMGVHGSLTLLGVHGFGPVSVEASPSGHTWSCADGGDPGAWRAIELRVERHVDAMLAAPFEATVRHDVHTQRPAHQSWQSPVLRGHLVRLEVVASQTLAPVTGLAAEADGSDPPRVSWDAVAGAAAYQVQWRWGAEAYGRVHTDNGEMFSREKRVTGTSHTVAVPSPAKRAEALTVRVRAYDRAALTVGAWREAMLAAAPGELSELTASSDSTTAIGLAWEAPAANGSRILGYGIEVSEDGARSWGTLEEDTGTTATAYVHRSLAPGEQRFYRVRARNGAGWGAWSPFAGTSTLRSGQASGALTARMGGLPERHDGSGSIGFKMTFSEPVTAGEDAVREHALSVTNGTVSEASRRDDEPGAFDMKVMPDSQREVTIVLPGGRPCAQTGAICTGDGRRLAHALSMAVPGPEPASANTAPTGVPAIGGTARVGEVLAASVEGVEDADGLTGATFAYQWLSGDGSTDTAIEGATGATYTVAAGDVGRTLTVRVTFTDDGGTEETLASAPSAAVAPGNTAPTGVPAIGGTARVGEVLAASVEGVADADGLTGATFAYQWLSGDGSTDTAIEGATEATYTVAAGDVGRTLTVRVTFTDDGGTEQTLTSAPSAAVAPALPVVSIAAVSSPVTEGARAAFTLSRTGDASAALTVAVRVLQAGSVLDGAAPAAVTFAAGSSSASLGVATEDDDAVEAPGRVTASVAPGDGYTIAPGSATAGIDVLDNERTAAAVTVLWSADMAVVDYETGTIGAASAELFSNQGGTAGLEAKWLWYYGPGRTLRLAFATVLPDAGDRTLHLGDVAIAFSEGSGGDAGFSWRGVDLDWTDGETLAVRVTGRAEGTQERPAPVEVSIAAVSSPVTEGAAAAFTLSRSGDASAPLSVVVAVSESGAMLAGEAPEAVTFEAGASTAALGVATEDDEAVEEASEVTAAVAAGDGYTLAADAASATVTAEDDDAAPVVTTAPAIAAPENATAVTTLAATDEDTAPESLVWSLAGGADTERFTLTEGGVLAFEAAKDYEAPDDADTDGAYAVTVRVGDGVNTGEAALTVTLSDVDEAAPQLTGAAVSGTALTLAFGEALDEGSVPAADAFAVEVDGAARGVGTVDVSGSAVTLALASAVAPGEAVTVGYAAPTGAGAAPLRDAAGNAVAGFSGEAVTNETPASANAEPTGVPAIGGTARVGEVLTASVEGIEDADGLSGAAFAYRWLSSDGTTDTPIEGATEAAYTVAAADVGRTLAVRVSFTDEGGTEETLTSAPTAAVAATVAGAPRELGVEAADGREGELVVSWAAPESDGGAAIGGYRVQWKSGAEDYDGTASSTRQAQATSLTHTIVGLANGVAYTVRVMAGERRGRRRGGGGHGDGAGPGGARAGRRGGQRRGAHARLERGARRSVGPGGGRVRGGGGRCGARCRHGGGVGERGHAHAHARLGGGVGRDGRGRLHGADGHERCPAPRRGGQRRGRFLGLLGLQRDAGARQRGADGASGHRRHGTGGRGGHGVGCGDRRR